MILKIFNGYCRPQHLKSIGRVISSINSDIFTDFDFKYKNQDIYYDEKRKSLCVKAFQESYFPKYLFWGGKYKSFKILNIELSFKIYLHTGESFYVDSNKFAKPFKSYKEFVLYRNEVEKTWLSLLTKNREVYDLLNQEYIELI